MREAKQRKIVNLKRSKRVNYNTMMNGFTFLYRKDLMIYLNLKTQSPVKRRVKLSVGSNCKTSLFISVKEWETFYKNMHLILTERNIVLESRQ